MQSGEFDEFRDALQAVHDFYGKDVSQFALDVWWEACKRFELQDVRAALSAHCQDPDRGQWMPKPADVIRLLEGGSGDRSLQAWSKVDRALAESFYSHLPMDDRALRRTLIMAIGSPAQFCHVVEVDGAIEGVLVGMVDKVWHSTKKQASDLVFYTSPKAKGAGAMLARRFIRWARKQKGVGLIGLSVSFGGPNIKRTGKMLEHMGLEYTGGIYLERKEL